jgi:outer membrane protein TolC
LGDRPLANAARPARRKAPQQDIIQADVEIGRQQERRLTLGRMLEVAVARINALMHLPPDVPLPPPPRQFHVSLELPDVQTARKSYETGLVPAVSVIEAERTRLALRDRYYEAVADYFRRLATLERAADGSLAPWPPGAAACPPGTCPAGRLVPTPRGPSLP